MTENQLYTLIFITIVTFFTFTQANRVSRMSNDELLQKNNFSRAIFVLMIFVVLFMGFRPMTVGGDTGRYWTNFVNMSRGLYTSGEESDWVFYTFQNYCAQLMSVSMFFFLVDLIYVGVVFLACKRFTSQNSTLMILFAMGAFSFFSYGTNGLRNGLATSFVVLAIAYIGGDLKDKILCVLLCFLALGCHKSTALPVAAMIFAYFVKWPKGMFYIWVLSIVASLVAGQAFSNVFMLFDFDDRVAGYVNLDESGETEDAIAKAGFRWDFLLYSAMPVILGYYTIVKKRMYDKTFLLLMGTYIYANAVWVMLIRLPFSNRFAYLSWFLYGIVLAYPLLKFNIWPRQGEKVKLIMLAHVGFTFFMWYYTL